MKHIFLPIFAGLFCASCALGPDYERPPLSVPESYRQQAPSSESIVNLPWWDVYGDEELKELIRIGLKNNKDLGAAFERINEARAVLGFVRADQFPEINIAGNLGKQEFESESQRSRSNEGYTIAPEAFFELDLWGRFRRATESARADLFATEEGYRTVLIALVADIASTYFLLRDLDAQLVISKNTLESRKQSTALVQARYGKGTVSLLDLNQAQIEEAEAEAALIGFERDVVRAENALSVLLGQTPSVIPRGNSIQQQMMPQMVPAGLPSDLLRRRPDVLSAEYAVESQTARIGVAEALRFPSIQLTAAFGAESTQLSDLDFGRMRFWSVGGNLFGPILSWDRNISRVQIEKTRTKQLILNYEQTLLRAFQEVEDALVSVRTFKAEYEVRKRQVAASGSAARLSRARYDGGESSYLEVLDAERSEFNSQLSASRTLRQHLNAVVQLYKALGGGWEPEAKN